MAIPSDAQFSDYLSLLRELNRELHAAGSFFLQFGEFTVEESDFNQECDAMMVGLQKALEQQGAHQVGKWFESQVTYTSALCKRERRRKPGGKGGAGNEGTRSATWRLLTADKTAADFNRSELKRMGSREELDSSILNANSTLQKSSRIADYFSAWANRNELTLIEGVAASFRDYFYGNRHEELVANYRTARDFIDSVKSSAIVLLHARDQNALVPVKIGGALSGRLARLLGEMEEAHKSIENGRAPIKRLDATSRERALAYDLWRVFRRNHLGNKTRSIHLLLQLEGVAGVLDQRSLERMISAWRA